MRRLTIFVTSIALAGVGVAAQDKPSGKVRDEPCGRFSAALTSPPEGVEFALIIAAPPEGVDYKLRVVDPCQEAAPAEAPPLNLGPRKEGKVPLELTPRKLRREPRPGEGAPADTPPRR